MPLDKKTLRISLESCSVTYTEELYHKYEAFADMMTEFNKKVNITRITDPLGITVKHIEDSLKLLDHIYIRKKEYYLDIGTGGGVPALPLLITEPRLKGLLIDSTAKKLAFAKEVCEKLALDAEVMHIRAEQLGKSEEYKEKFDLITARAVAGLDVITGYAAPLLKKGGVFAAYKGDISAVELNAGTGAAEKYGLTKPEVIKYELTNGDKRTLILIKK